MIFYALCLTPYRAAFPMTTKDVPYKASRDVLELLYLRAGMDRETFVERLAQEMKKAEPKRNIRAIRQQVRGWIDGLHEPKGKSRDFLTAFFARIWPEGQPAFDLKSLSMSAEQLMAQDESYMKAANERKKFTGIFKKYQDYVDTVKDGLEALCTSHEHDFYLYRKHSNGKLVQDFLRVEGHGKGHVLAYLYQYSEHKTAIKEYEGFGFFYRRGLFYLIFTTPTEMDGPEPSFLIFDIDNQNKYVKGTVSGVSDKHHPSCGVVLMKKCKETRMDDPKKCVGALSDLKTPRKTIKEINEMLLEAIREQISKYYKEKSPE